MTRVAINGFGRIGRNFLRAYFERRPDYEVVAVNDVGDVKMMAHLLEFDSLLGRLSEEVTAEAATIIVGERELQAFQSRSLRTCLGASSASMSSSNRPAVSRSAAKRRRISMPAQAEW